MYNGFLMTDFYKTTHLMQFDSRILSMIYEDNGTIKECQIYKEPKGYDFKKSLRGLCTVNFEGRAYKQLKVYQKEAMKKIQLFLPNIILCRRTLSQTLIQ